MLRTGLHELQFQSVRREPFKKWFSPDTFSPKKLVGLTEPGLTFSYTRIGAYAYRLYSVLSVLIRNFVELFNKSCEILDPNLFALLEERSDTVSLKIAHEEAENGGCLERVAPYESKVCFEAVSDKVDHIGCIGVAGVFAL